MSGGHCNLPVNTLQTNTRSSLTNRQKLLGSVNCSSPLILLIFFSMAFKASVRRIGTATK